MYLWSAERPRPILASEHRKQKNAFDIRIFRDGCACSIWFRIILGRCRFSHACECEVTKYRPGIIMLSWFGISFGRRGLQVFWITSFIMPVLVLTGVFWFGWTFRFILPAGITKRLWKTAKVDILRPKRLEGIQFSIKGESPIITGLESWYLLRGSLYRSSGSSAMSIAPCIIMILWIPCSLGLWLRINVGLDGDGYFWIFEDVIYHLLGCPWFSTFSHILMCWRRSEKRLLIEIMSVKHVRSSSDSGIWPVCLYLRRAAMHLLKITPILASSGSL